MARVTEHHVDIISVNTKICCAAEKIAASIGGISVTQYRVLLRLYAARKPLKMSDLAKQLLLSQSSATAVIDKLEQRDAIIRLATKQDRRLVRVTLAPGGISLIKNIDKALTDQIERMRNLLSSEQCAVMDSRCIEVSSHFGYTRKENDRIRTDTAFLDTALLMHAQMIRAAKIFGLSINDYRVLYVLGSSLDRIQTSHIAQELLMRTSEVTVSANKLAARELIERHDDPLDRRVSLLEVTSQGFALRQEAAVVMADYILHTHPAETAIIDVHDSVAYTIANHLRAKRIFANQI